MGDFIVKLLTELVVTLMYTKEEYAGNQKKYVTIM